MKQLRRYWGILALLVALLGWAGLVAGSFAASSVVTVILIASAGSVVYFLFQAPLWCRAETRAGQPCRNNSHGLLIGCYLREHKWQRLKLAFYPSKWRALNGKLWASARDGAATVGGIGSAVSGIAAVVAIMVH
jgi:hypothetical protein